MLWSPPCWLAGATPEAGPFGSLGFGVEVRELAHGVIDSTADERYDFSCFFGGADEVIPSSGQSSRPGFFSVPVQAETGLARAAGKYSGTFRATPRKKRAANATVES